MVDRPITRNWMSGEEPLTKPAVKIILHRGLFLVGALVRGGRLDIGCERQGEGVEIALHAEADRILVDADVERILAEGETNATMTSRTAPAVLVQAVAAQNGGQVMLARETPTRSEENTSELQSLMRISYAVFCLKKKNRYTTNRDIRHNTIIYIVLKSN